MAKAYATLPANAAKVEIEPFEIHVEEQKLQDFKTLLRLSPIWKDCYENQEAQKEKAFGVTREWLVNAKAFWENEFDWRKHEEFMNSFPQFKAQVKDDDGYSYSIHFAALFSSKKDAVPIMWLHGWPSTFAEFLPLADLLRKKYSPADLPYHIIIPSLPGYSFSDAPPLDKDWVIADTARIMHKLMLVLGFSSGYIVQGGDIGAAVSRTMTVTYPECKAMHLNHNYMTLSPEEEKEIEPSLSATEKKGLVKFKEFGKTGNAYGRMHGTRPSTIGAVLSASPLALLAWMGDKYLEWTETDLPIDVVLSEISLYWFTGCIGTSIYTYREDYRLVESSKGYFHGQESMYVDKPFGYSHFPGDIAPLPKKWVERSGRLVWSRFHETGGHFPALEKPVELLEDVEDFVRVAWK